MQMRKRKNTKWKADDLSPLGALRFNAGFARDQAAVSMQISNTTLYYYENGFKDIPFTIIHRMAELYNVSMENVCQAILATPKAVQEKKNPKNDFEILKDRAVLEKAVAEANNLKEAEPV